jgi:hypothetical protein
MKPPAMLGKRAAENILKIASGWVGGAVRVDTLLARLV